MHLLYKGSQGPWPSEKGAYLYARGKRGSSLKNSVRENLRGYQNFQNALQKMCVIHMLVKCSKFNEGLFQNILNIKSIEKVSKLQNFSIDLLYRLQK